MSGAIRLSVAGLALAVAVSGCSLFSPFGGLNARECMTRVMYFESNRSSADGMLAVGTVVMNRVEDRNYPKSVCGVVGQASVDFINQFKVDFALVGISGIDEDGSLLDFDYQEVRVSQAIIANARQVILAADSSKFGRNAMVRLGSISLIDCLVTDQPPVAALAHLLNQYKIRLDVV